MSFFKGGIIASGGVAAAQELFSVVTSNATSNIRAVSAQLTANGVSNGNRGAIEIIG